jgi:plasmid stabilization system protein ParE
MKLVYSLRALADLEQIAIYYSANASPAIAEAIGHRLENVIDRICRGPMLPHASRNAPVSVSSPLFVTHSRFSTERATIPSIFCIYGTPQGDP